MKTLKVIFFYAILLLFPLLIHAQITIESEDCEVEFRKPSVIVPIIPQIKHIQGTNIYTMESPIVAQTLACDKGTTIAIPDSAFVDERGQLIITPVNMEVKECYALSDMLTSKLNTQTQNGILETGGMIYLNATTSDGRKAKLAPNKSLSITVPNENPQTGMSIFTAQYTNKENFNWQSTIKKAYWGDRLALMRKWYIPTYEPITFKYDIAKWGEKTRMKVEVVSIDSSFSPFMRKMLKYYFRNPNYIQFGKFYRKYIPIYKRCH